MRITLALLIVLASTAASAQTPLRLSDGKWELEGDRTVIETVEGKETIAFETGSAARRDVRFQDGTVDFDVQLTRRRSFVYLKFRMASPEEHEEIYLRPHKSSLPDAIQYAPVFDGQSAWQLFHGPGGTAPVAFEPGAWTHVRLVVKGSQAVVFVNDLARPAMIVPRLARPPAPGYIAVQGFLPANVPGSGPIARYANITVRPDYVPFDFSTVTAPDAVEPARIQAWQVSKPFAPGPGPMTSLPADLLRDGGQRVVAEPSGRVVLNRFVAMPYGPTGAGAAARVMVRATDAGVRRLDLGYSDTATVFLNGQVLYHGDAHYSFDAPRQEGLLTYDQASLYLPLRAGDNDLVVVVTDTFGGWGLQGRFPDPRGLTVEAR